MGVHDIVEAGNVGDWDGREQEAADFLNDLNARLCDLLGDDASPTREEYAADLADRIFFEELCGNPDMLEWDADARQAYVERKFN